MTGLARIGRKLKTNLSSELWLIEKSIRRKGEKNDLSLLQRIPKPSLLGQVLPSETLVILEFPSLWCSSNGKILKVQQGPRPQLESCLESTLSKFSCVRETLYQLGCNNNNNNTNKHPTQYCEEGPLLEIADAFIISRHIVLFWKVSKTDM